MDVEGYFRFVAALAFVLALIGIMAWLARRFGLGQPARPSGQSKRLRIVETLALDARRRLVLVSRDATEHLLLIGGPNDVVVRSARASPRTVETGVTPLGVHAHDGAAAKDPAP